MDLSDENLDEAFEAAAKNVTQHLTELESVTGSAPGVGLPMSEEVLEHAPNHSSSQVAENLPSAPKETSLVKKEGDDIEFEEPNIDIDAITKQIEQLPEGQVAASVSKDSSENEMPASLNPLVVASNGKCKKYVIYIDPENIDYIENLSIPERKKAVNEILNEQDSRVKRRRAAEQRASFIKHLLVACFTFVIGFPVMFYSVNRAMELTIQSYRQSQKNFENLYRERGKVKVPEVSTLQKYKY